MDKLKNIHPGDVLDEEFLKPLGITAYKLAQAIGVPQTLVSEIIRGKRRVTAATALRLAAYFGTSEAFWLNLQARYDVEEARAELGDALAAIRPHTAPAA